MDIRTEIRKGLHSSGRSLSDLARSTGVDKGNLSRFLSGKSGIGVEKLERLLEELSINVSQTVPQSPEWLQRVDEWQERLQERLPEIPVEDLRQILSYSLRPVEERIHFVKTVDNRYDIP